MPNDSRPVYLGHATGDSILRWLLSPHAETRKENEAGSPTEEGESQEHEGVARDRL